MHPNYGFVGSPYGGVGMKQVPMYGTPHPQQVPFYSSHPHYAVGPPHRHSMYQPDSVSMEVKSDKSSDTASKMSWSNSAFLGPNLWEKEQLYTHPAPPSTVEKNFKVENIDIDEFLNENNLNLHDIDSFSTNFEQIDPPATRSNSNSPDEASDPLLLHSPMQAAPARSPQEDSQSRQSSHSSRKFSLDEATHKKSKKTRKATHDSKQFVPDEMKDEKYWARRRKNNLAAKRSRDARRMKENQIALRADFLEREAEQIRKQLDEVKRENHKLKMKIHQLEAAIKQ